MTTYDYPSSVVTDGFLEALKINDTAWMGRLIDLYGLEPFQRDGSPLCLAAEKGTLEACVFLLDRGFPVDGRSVAGGFTPLMIAARLDRRDLALIFLEHGSELSLKSDSTGITAFGLALFRGHDDLARILQAWAARKAAELALEDILAVTTSERSAPRNDAP